MIRTAVAIVVVAVAVVLSQQPLTKFAVHENGAVVISGASSGLGKDLALHLATRPGVVVFAGVRKKADGDALLAAASSLEPPVEPATSGLEPLMLDVTSEASIAAAKEVVQRRLAELNIPLIGIVNNAGVGYRAKLADMDMAEVRKAFEVNVFGVLSLTKAFDPLLARPGGRIVNTGSFAGLIALPGWVPYSTTKYAVESISDTWRRELQPSGVSVSCIEPGYVASRLCDRPECQRNTPSETTTPAFVHALFSPRPKARYPVSTVIAGIPASFFQYVLIFMPDRLKDHVALLTNAGGDAVKSHQRR